MAGAGTGGNVFLLAVLLLATGCADSSTCPKQEPVHHGSSGPPPAFGRHFSNGTAEPARLLAVREAFVHSWTGFQAHAGCHHDELRPVTNGSYSWMNISLTCISALDTLYLMGLHDDFNATRSWLAEHWSIERDLNVSLFETTIRVLGGFLGAYEVSRDPLFLTLSTRLADKLLWAFNTTSGLPYPSINLQTHVGAATWGSHVTTLAEIGTLQLEFEYLSWHSGDPRYTAKTRAVYDQLDRLDPPGGLYPLLYDIISGDISDRFGRTVTLGGSADSFYESLLKLWLLSDREDAHVRRLYDEAVDGIVRHLLRRSTPSGALYVVSFVRGHVVDAMDHLSCFLPGMLALGARGHTKERDLEVARGLATTCANMYLCQVTGLAPDAVVFRHGSDFEASVRTPNYMLRPETVESLFILFRLTGDQIYRDWAWKIFGAIQRHCRTPSGFSGFADVRSSHSRHDDIQQAYFFSETLKYLYLLFGESQTLPLSKYVFNTEAHPLKKLGRSFS